MDTDKKKKKLSAKLTQRPSVFNPVIRQSLFD